MIAKRPLPLNHSELYWLELQKKALQRKT